MPGKRNKDEDKRVRRLGVTIMESRGTLLTAREHPGRSDPFAKVY